MATIPDLIARARLEMGDVAKSFDVSVLADGITSRFDVPPRVVDVPGLNVTLDDGQTTTVLASNAFSFLQGQGLLVTNSVPAAGTTVRVTGTGYNYFDDDDWTTFVTSALDQHIYHQQGVELASLPQEEEYPVAIYAVVQALYALVNDAAFDIDISTPEGVTIPRHQRYEQLWAMLQARQAQYDKICLALNVGLWRIEMRELRRKSLTTGRLVPVYEPQEFEDTRPAFRVWPTIDTLGGREEPVLDTPTLDLVAHSWQDFTTTITLNMDVTNYKVAAGVRRYPQAYVPLAWFKVTVLDAPTGKVQLEMNSRLNYYLGLSKFWDMQLIDKTTGDTQTVYQGRYDAIPQGLPYTTAPMSS